MLVVETRHERPPLDRGIESVALHPRQALRHVRDLHHSIKKLSLWHVERWKLDVASKLHTDTLVSELHLWSQNL